jgi:hypothetical protein
LAFDADGKLLAVGGDGVYDVESGQRQFSVSGYSVAFSPNDKLLAVSGDGMYDIQNGEQRFKFASLNVMFSLDGKLIRTFYDTVYETETGVEIRTDSDFVKTFYPFYSMLTLDYSVYDTKTGEQILTTNDDWLISQPSIPIIAVSGTSTCLLLSIDPNPSSDVKGFLTIYNNDKANIRSTSGEVLAVQSGTLGTTAQAYDSQYQLWYKVNYAPNQFGWVSASVVDVALLPVNLPTESWR